MTTKRTYGEGCAAAHALDLVGERWALLIVRELLLGPKRFTDLRVGMPNASPNVLSQRLRDLVWAGVVRRHKLPPPAGSWVYELTDWGRDLEPVIMALGRWGVRSPWFPRDAGMSVDAFILALRTLFDPQAAEDFTARYALRIGEEQFRAEVAGGQITLARGVADQVDASIEANLFALIALLWNDLPLAEAQHSGDVKIEGDLAAVLRFLKLFPPPAPVASAAPV